MKLTEGPLRQITARHMLARTGYIISELAGTERDLKGLRSGIQNLKTVAQPA